MLRPFSYRHPAAQLLVDLGFARQRCCGVPGKPEVGLLGLSSAGGSGQFYIVNFFRGVSTHEMQ
jgi:hypothetical protein